MPANETYTLIRGDRLIDGLGGAPVEDGAVLLRGDRIAAVGRASEIAVPEGAQVVTCDYPGKTIMPGLVDCHTHHNGFGDGRPGEDVAAQPDEVLMLQSARNARASLVTGVTTIRENGPKNTTMFRLRDAVNQGILIAPRMVLCGRPVAIVGGHMGYFGTEVTGAVEAKRETRRLIQEGADYIKITATGGSTRTSFPLRPSFTLEELKAVTEEAQNFGKLTATHCLSTQGIVNSLDAGVDMIVHCAFMEADGSNNFREDVAERIGEQGAFVNPTLHVGRARAWRLMLKREEQGLTAEEAARLDEGLRAYDDKLDDCRRMQEMGLKVITGSDSSWGDYALGNTFFETECLVDAGYSAMRGVVSVTSEAAKALDLFDEVGSLEPGKAADVIVVDGNPAEDIGALWNVEDVYFGGRLLDRGSSESVDAFRQVRPDSSPI